MKTRKKTWLCSLVALGVPVGVLTLGAPPPRARTPRIAPVPLASPALSVTTSPAAAPSPMPAPVSVTKSARKSAPKSAPISAPISAPKSRVDVGSDAIAERATPAPRVLPVRASDAGASTRIPAVRPAHHAASRLPDPATLERASRPGDRTRGAAPIAR